uniref:Upstream stimulatory factor 2 n=1 Tax=Cacopsylla melanoneura TaxID=428564 RepID=A0A8D8LDI2_9HEMI
MSSNKQEVCLNPDLDQISVSVSLHGTLESTEDGMTYRLIQVDSMKDESSVDPNSLSPILQSTPEYSEKTTSLMNEALNGEFYVLNPASELFTTASNSKPVANTGRHSNAVRVRDERKRASHNEVERRRRDKINTWILKLGTLIPEEPSSPDKNVECQSLRSKGGILAKACDHIVELRAKNQNLEKYIKANEQLVSKLDRISKQNLELKYENNVLKNMLLENGLIVETSSIKKEDSNPS